MKNLIITFWSFFSSRFVQILLLFIAWNSWLEISNLGHSFTDSRINRIGDGHSTSGFNGGAIAMGLVASICIFGVVWLEIIRTKKA